MTGIDAAVKLNRIESTIYAEYAIILGFIKNTT